MPFLKEKHFSRFLTNICTLLFVIVSQVNIWSSVKSIHASSNSHFHFIVNLEEHYFKCEFCSKHMFLHFPFPALLSFPRHWVTFTWSWDQAIAHQWATHITCTLWITMYVVKIILQLQDEVKCLSPIHFTSQLMKYGHAQLHGLPCKHQLAKTSGLWSLAIKHIQGVARSWEPVKCTVPYHCGYLERITEQHCTELGTEYNAVGIMKRLLLLHKHGLLPNTGLDCIFTF